MEMIIVIKTHVFVAAEATSIRNFTSSCLHLLLEDAVKDSVVVKVGVEVNDTGRQNAGGRV